MCLTTVLLVDGLEKHLDLDLRLVGEAACPHALCWGYSRSSSCALRAGIPCSEPAVASCCFSCLCLVVLITEDIL